MRDNQRQKCYDWERQFQNKHTYCKRTFANRCHDEMTMDEVKALVAKVNRHINMRPTKIDPGAGRKRAYSYGGEIALPRWARQPVVVLHEMAHEVHRYLGRYRQAVHGPEFVGIEMYLLVKFAGYDIKELVRTANEVNLRFISQNTVREKIRELRARQKRAA